VSVAKAEDVAYVRFRAPDIGRMQQFLTAFGMVPVERSAHRLVMRGHDSSPFCHVTEVGDPAFVSLGIWVRSAADLAALAAHDGAAVEALDAPGGGRVVRLRDPDGFLIEAVAEQQRQASLQLARCVPWNQGGSYPRKSEVRRTQKGSSHVVRLGHVVLGVSDFRRSEAWYKERFGFITSDEIQTAPGVAAGAFLRCDRGDRPCDHHTLFLVARPAPPGFMHAAFEVADMDDLMAGHDHLESAGEHHHWGVGRHYLGSQVFDYWKDPWGHEMEHWTDGDRLVAADGGGIGTLEELMSVQWGMEMPPLPLAGEPD
jgi:catechol 2,3-dioxygenase-like lactoylglutathione lyase family enzyme